MALGALQPGTYTLEFGAGGASAGYGAIDTITVGHGRFASVATPEPSTSAMMLVGLAGLGLAGCRASRKSAKLVV